MSLPPNFDPNKTQLGAPVDPNKTQLGFPVDPNKTQAIGAAPVAGDPNRTTAMGPMRGLEVTLLASREATIANGPAREQFLLEMASPSEPGLPGLATSGTRTPLNLCLVIDRSGSMEGAPLDYVKQACAYVVDLLTPNDVLSIVTFEETVDVLMAPQRVTSKQPIKDGIQRLQPGNTTNIYDGMLLAAQQLAAAPDPGRATRMVVFSDGEPTAGIKDFASLVRHAGEIKERGISCTFLGFGPDYNEELLASMAKKAGGNYYYIPEPHMIPEVFRAELEKLVSTTASNLRFTMKLSRWVSLRAATGHTVPPGDREFTLTLSDVDRGAMVQQVFDMEFPNHPLGSYRVAAGKLAYDDAIAGKTESVDVDFVMEFTADPARYGAAPNPLVAQAAQVAAASRVVEKTVMGLKTGALSGPAAVAELQKTQALLLQDGRVQEAQEVTLALRAIQAGDHGGAEKTLMGTMVQLDQGKKKS